MRKNINNNVIFKALMNDEIYKSFLENTKSLIWILSEDSTLLFANNSFLNYFRLEKTDFNKRTLDILPLAVTDALYEKHLHIFQTGIPYNGIESTKVADGTNLVFHVNLFPIYDDKGKMLLGGVATDQTEKSTIELKLKQANESYYRIRNISSDAIWEWDIVNGDIFRNDKLQQLIGYTTSEQKELGLVWWINHVHPDDKENLNELLKKVLDDKLQSWESNYRFLCADGEYKNMFDRGFVIYEDDIAIKMIGSLTDLTNQKLMEDLLVEEKLSQIKSIAETGMRVQEQERTRLGREMHDNVNQILSTIKLFIGMLKPEEESQLELKDKAIEYTMMAIEEIRKLSKEMVAPELNEGNLSANIWNLVEDLSLTTSLKIKFVHDEDLTFLSPSKKINLFRVVQESFKNILKYSNATEVEVNLTNNTSQVNLMIRDNGIGFDMKKTSTGIGLSNIKDRVKFHEGTINILSAIGEGCQINIQIPI